MQCLNKLETVERVQLPNRGVFHQNRIARCQRDQRVTATCVGKTQVRFDLTVDFQRMDPTWKSVIVSWSVVPWKMNISAVPPPAKVSFPSPPNSV